MEKRRVDLTMISAETDFQETDDAGFDAAGNAAGLLLKVLRSLDRNTTGPISDEALAYANRLLEELTAEIKMVSPEDENWKACRNLERVREFGTSKLAQLQRRLRAKERVDRQRFAS
ncbi:uncharacterized protein LOC100908730 [Galendromus occidentalis]|uniref:Uncharacterized protein LOC100908730 n=1 Tax=Galendromus occidentalis TaxID=34638 RepID=A0AAJ6QS62_9ACAR|nr:uncharacterized protein LOC100908730 [Galendromus occidentalis]